MNRFVPFWVGLIFKSAFQKETLLWDNVVDRSRRSLSVAGSQVTRLFHPSPSLSRSLEALWLLTYRLSGALDLDMVLQMVHAFHDTGHA